MAHLEVTMSFDAYHQAHCWTVWHGLKGHGAVFPGHIYGSIRARRLAFDLLSRVRESGDWERELERTPKQ
jgi:hypothetical protein